MLTPLIYVLAFVAVVLLIQTLAGVVFTTGDRNRRVNRRLTMLQSGMTQEQVYAALVRKPVAPSVVRGRLGAVYDRVVIFVHQAGMAVSPFRLLAIVAAGAAVLWLVSLALVHSADGAGAVVNGAVSLVASSGISLAAVWFWVNSRRNARLKKIEEQLPLALDIVNRAIRAGHPVVSAVQLAADELGDPIGTEFGLIVDETTYGYEFKDALISFAHRTGSPDAHFFAVSVGIQSETGGNLAEILEGLAGVIRGRGTLAKRVKALSSEGKASAQILSALPALLVATFSVFEPRFYTDKFSDPIFWPVVIFILLLYGLGWIIIHRIINFRY
jgi:tight adherence protein B